MTNFPNPSTESISTPTGTVPPKRARPPFLGIIALVAIAIAPAWLLLALITGGLEAAAWIPLLVLISPLNIVFLALFIVTVVCGILAVRKSGANRVLGWIALSLAAVLLLASIVFVFGSLTDIMYGG